MDNPAEHKARKKGSYNAKGKNTPEEHGTNIPKGWKPSLQHPLPAYRCTAIVKNGERAGERCNKWAIEGMAEYNAKCSKHGAQIPVVKEAAQERIIKARKELMGLAPTAVEVIDEIMRTGDNDGVRLKAAQDVLDRTGVLKGQEIKMEVEDKTNTAQIIRERLAEMRQSMLEGNDVVSVEEVVEDVVEEALEED